MTETVKNKGSFIDSTRAVLCTSKFWRELVIMILGMAVGAAAVYYFMIPGKLVLGSISGLSIVISNLAATFGINLSVSTLVLIINAILLILAWLLIGKEFGAKTIFTALILGPLLDFWAWVLPYETLIPEGQTSVMGDVWGDLLCFVLLVSFSQTILFHINASTGGLDILAKIVNKYFHFDIGASVTVAGALICCTAFSINPFRLVVVGLIGTWINGLALDHFTEGLNRRKRVCIISKEYDRIRKYITEDLQRGCSLYTVNGGYSGEEYIEIQALLTMDEYSSVLNFIKENKLQSFITAGNVSEVYGLWHNKKRKTIEGGLD